MLTCVILDDNELHRLYLLNQIQQLSLAECVGMAENAVEAREILKNTKPDFIFLDIEMPAMNGIEFMNSLQHPPFVIFVTSHRDFALDAFELNAVDYLIKPVKADRLVKAVEKAETLVKMYKKSVDGDIVNFSDNKYFFVKDKGIFHRIFHKEVLYIQSMGDFSSIFLDNGMKKVALVGIKNFEHQLDCEDFIRVSRTHLVNLKKITAISNDSVFLGKVEISVGSTYQEDVLNKIVNGKVIKRFI
ncbi:MAG: LytTR family DNA-binding domain-containing protein [Spirosomaceae bacterium]|jgi:DNA-binding LytR/AlgR family response regulator|nr:LytTR family DNA-binding domain-containing protein [Spirosomataceae bacterium]